MIRCSIQECELPVLAKGYCSKHYTQINRHGKILDRTPYTPNEFIIDGDVCKIGCYDKDGSFVAFGIIDLEDMDKCKEFKWRVDNGYLDSKNGRIHNFILKVTPSKAQTVDHINRDRLDNRKENLRLCPTADNNCNVGIKSNNKSGYKGVFWYADRKKWLVSICKKGVSIHLGYFKTAVEGAKAYNEKAIELHGEFACLNKIPLIRRIRR